MVAAPTGSGKTLAAFLASLNQLFCDAVEEELADETLVLYVSPLKALSNDIHRNLTGPLAEIAETMETMGYGQPEVRAAVRTGDTTAAERRRILQRPPHILVTTPESLFLLLTSKSGRGLLRSVRTLILDEIHALANNRRGAHLSLSIERLDALTQQPLQRIGLSATQKPMSLVARYLVGTRHLDEKGEPLCTIVDEGHLKQLDLALELPESPLEAVMANEVWEEVYQRLLTLIQDHQTTLIFVNTRRLAERMTFRLHSALGAGKITSHHGSLSLQIRHLAERQLKEGQLKALVATASMELGIDIGSVDLVCQIGSPRAIATLLQRIGRAGHHLGGIPKGRVFPLTRDELLECTALLKAVHENRLETLEIAEQPLDVLSQQVVAAVAGEDWAEDDLLALIRNAWIYRNLEASKFRELLHMLADGITTKRGRRGAYLYYDAVNRRIKARKGARLTALTNAGAIPDNADFRVLLEPQGTFVGTVNEDFAVESIPGNVFRLGNHSWRIVKIENGTVRVEDAAGMPPTIPFWFGEAPGRSLELSATLSSMKAELGQQLQNPADARHYLAHLGLPETAVQQLLAYLFAGQKALGILPTQEHVVLERFFDEAGGMQLVIHAPFGSRINRAWGLALRKKFCRSFNFELQAAATEDAIVLSLGPRHSFPLEDVFQFLKPVTAKEVLIQALLDSPLFQTRWRWTAGRALALVRQRGGRYIPPNLQRMEADDLLAVIFPDQQACLENIAGDREVPDHLLIAQTIEDCLHEAMDVEGFIRVLEGLASGRIKQTALDLPEPSPLAHEVLNAMPYAFLDDAPLEERRTRAVYLRRSLDPETIRDQGLLDEAAIATVREQAWPSGDRPDEVHEALILLGGIPLEKLNPDWQEHLPKLREEYRAGLFHFQLGERQIQMAIAAERLPQWQALRADGRIEPDLIPPPRERERRWEPESAVLDLVRGLMEACGPQTVSGICEWFGLEETEIYAALLALESEGMVLRGHFDHGLEAEEQWCNRRLLARIHHLTLHRLRERIKPVATQTFMRFLFQWQRVGTRHHMYGPEGLDSVIELLEAFPCAAGAWEADILPARVKGYAKSWLDQLSLQGRVAWARITPPTGAANRGGPLKTTPIAFFPRVNTALWTGVPTNGTLPSTYALQVIEALRQRGALFFAEIQKDTGLLHSHLEMALGELVALGMVTCDAFSGLRHLLLPANRKPTPHRRMRVRMANSHGIEYAGRWSLLIPNEKEPESEDRAERLEYHAAVLLRRYGVVFRALTSGEPDSPPWRDLLSVYRHLEAVGEIRGGRFVEGFSGEQFALPEAIPALRAKVEETPDQQMIALSGADPLNLTAHILPGPNIGRTASNRILFSDGLPIAAIDGGTLHTWPYNECSEHLLRQLLTGKPRKNASFTH